MKLLRTFQRRTAQPQGQREDGIALLTAIMLIMVVGALSVLMLGVVVAQVQPTLFTAKNSRTVAAAEAGIDAALSQLRSATTLNPISGDTLGDPRKLPCTVQGSVTGDSSDPYAYRVEVAYFDADPRDQNATWRAANELTCGATGLTVIPSFAVLTAEGMDANVPGRDKSVGERTIETVYTFQMINDNVVGGPIYSYGNGFCLEADSENVGATISYVNAALCLNDDPRRQWSWLTDYKIHLSVTDLPTRTPLCLTGRPTGSTPVNATLQVCDATRTDQLFSWYGGAKFKVQDASNNESNYCLGTGSSSTPNPTGRKLMVGACSDNVTWSSFSPDPRLGAAKASKATNQLVNFLEFGRCADVTQQDAGKPFMIIYPCKQNPNGGGVFWNHRWYYNEPVGLIGRSAGQKVEVRNGSLTYCMKTAADGAAPAYVTLTSSCGDATTTWYRTAETGDYATGWRFEDHKGRCLSVGPKNATAGGDLPNWSTMIVATCSSAPDQKWNAPPMAQEATVDNFRELDN